MYSPYPMFPQPQMPQYNQFQQPQQQPQQNQSGIVHVQTEDEWRNYPVAPGNTIIFKNDNAPYIYTKTMDSSQLGQPIFEKFRLVKEEDKEVIIDSPKVIDSKYEEDMKAIKSDIKYIRDRLSNIEKQKRQPQEKGGEQK